MIAKPAEVRAARAFLRQRGVSTKEIPPKKFANSAKELGKGFRELLKTMSRMQSGGQNQSRERRENIAKAVSKE